MAEMFTILESITEDDEDFSEGMQTGYMSFYDQAPPRPASSCTALYEFMCKNEFDHSPRWWTGYLAGWFIGFGENNPAFIWQSDPPPAHLQG